MNLWSLVRESQAKGERLGRAVADRDPTGWVVLGLGAVVLAAFMGGFFYAILWIAQQLHAVAVLMVAALLLFYGLGARVALELFSASGRATRRRRLGGEPLPAHHEGLPGFFAIALLAPMLALAFASPILQARGWVGYTTQPDVHEFLAYYAWILVDMIPGLDVWGSFAVAAPLEPTDVAARAVAFGFRVVVVAGILRFIAQWARARQAFRSGANPDDPAANGVSTGPASGST